MTIWQRVMQGLQTQSKAFTLLDSLLTLAVTSFVVVGLALSINHVFASVEEQLFFADFEQLYVEAQTLSAIQERPSQLTVSSVGIQSEHRLLPLPKTLRFEGQQSIQFDRDGGNSSLAKLVFYTKDKAVKYQLQLGSGKYQKTESESLHTP